MQITSHTKNTPILEWQAQIRKDHERSQQWYHIAGWIVTAIILYGIVSSAWLMSLSISLAAGLYYLVRDEKNPTTTLKIFETGVEYRGIFIPWNNCRKFWILIAEDYAELHIARKGFHPEIVILNGSIDPIVIRDTLSQFLEHDDEKNEQILDTLSRYCKI